MCKHEKEGAFKQSLRGKALPTLVGNLYACISKENLYDIINKNVLHLKYLSYYKSFHITKYFLNNNF